MKIKKFSWQALIVMMCVFFPIFAKLDYSKFSADAPEVEQAAHLAIEKLGDKGGAITLSDRVIDIHENVIDIIGIPSGIKEGGIAIKSRVEEMETALKDLGAEVTETEIKVELPSDILFDFDKSDIRPDANEALSKVALIIRETPIKNVLIEGHTDSVGSETYNIELSLKRAASVSLWFVKNEGFDKNLFETKGWGESRPKSSNDSEKGRQKNRRVEIVIEKE
jgi:outer membrane protein OmpA-like peptidoglycan-associated protein